jgi:hypothetical protein
MSDTDVRAAERLVIECAIAWDTYKNHFWHGDAAARELADAVAKLKAAERASLGATDGEATT